MPATLKLTRPVLFAFFAALFSLQCLPLIFENSLTNDEPFEITGGCYYWKHGDVITTRMQPPLAAALQTLPLIFTPLQWPRNFTNADDRAYGFFFVSNPAQLQLLTAFPRLVTLLLGLGIGCLIFAACKKESWTFILVALGLWALDPNLIANSAIAKSDIPLAFFFCLAFMGYSKASLKSPWPHSLGAGLLTGMAITTKVTGLCLFPIYLLLELVRAKFKFRPAKAREVGGRLGLVLTGSLLWIILAYLPGTLRLAGHRNPLAYYLDKVATGWRISQKGWAHFYFMGQTSDVSNILYLPTAFLLKSTLPFLFLLLAAFFLAWSKKIQVKPAEWIPPLVFFVSVLPASSFGIRMMLPALPFLFRIAARAAEWMWTGTPGKHRKFFRRGLAALGLWLGATLAVHYPNYLSYANELVGSGRKVFYIADADLDWGQDHIRLNRLAQKRAWKNIKLASFAGADPRFYGLEWQPWTARDLQGPQPGSTYLIDTSFFQLAPAFFPGTAAIVRGWISRAPPTGRLGDTWYYYEIPGTPPRDNSPKIPSVPGLSYYWSGDQRIRFSLPPG